MPEQQINEEPPVEQVIEMLNQGYENKQIIDSLQNSGFSNQAISEAINIAHTKASVEGMPPPPSPQMKRSLLDSDANPQRQEQQEFQFTQSFAPSQQVMEMPARDIQEHIEEIAESIINEKWQRALEEIGDLTSWKENVRSDLISIKQEVLRLENKFEILQSAIAGKINEYGRGMQDVGAEIKAVEKLLQNIINPLANNVKELSKITERLKK